jgi:hypothetical protein
VGLNVYHIGLKYTSETVASAAFNAIPVITFFLAFLMRFVPAIMISFSFIYVLQKLCKLSPTRRQKRIFTKVMNSTFRLCMLYMALFGKNMITW